MKPSPLAAVSIGAGVAVVAVVLAIATNILPVLPRDPLSVDVITYSETTGGVGIDLVRIKLTNNSGMELTNVVVDLGSGDTKRFPRINNGESIFITPDDPGKVSQIVVTTDQGLSVTKKV